MSVVMDNAEVRDSSIRFERHMEKRCAKLREEILLFQASSLKEHANLCKKLDAETREKRELARQLAMANKEQRATRQELEELLEEKNSLQKKLDAATSEFKMNVKTKKSALAELEEALNKIDVLTAELDKVTKEKIEMEEKAKKFKDKYEKMKKREATTSEGDYYGELTKYKNSLLRSIYDEKEHAIDLKPDESGSMSSRTEIHKHRSKHDKRIRSSKGKK